MSVSLISKIEALLFVSGKPMSFNNLAKVLSVKVPDVKKTVQDLQQLLVDENRGLRLVVTDSSVQLFTAPELHELVEDYLKTQQNSELTRPQLETLAIIAYRGPIIKEVLEQIRGVNCSMILRNLLIRGLVIEQDTAQGLVYSTSEDFLSHLGVGSVNELPEYDKLSQNDDLDKIAMTREEMEDKTEK